MSLFFFFFGGGARLSFLHNTDSSLLRTARYKALKTLLALPLPRGYRFNMVTVFTRISATQMKCRPRILRQKVNKPRPRISAVALIKSKSKGVVCWIGKLEWMCWTFFYSFGSCFYIRGFLTKARLPADVSYFFYGARTTPWREMWIPEYGKFLLVESGIWEFFLRNPGLWNPEYNSRNPESHWRVESGIQASSTDKKNPEFMSWNPQSKTRFPYIGQKLRPALLPLFSDKETFCWLGSWIHDQRHKPSSPFTANLCVDFSYPK